MNQGSFVRVAIHKMGYAPAVFAPRVISLVLVVVFTRLLTPEEFGLYALTIVCGELLDGVIFSWARLGFLRFRDRVPTADALLPGAVLMLVCGIVAALGVLSVVWHVLGGVQTNQFLLALSLYLVGVATLRFALNVMRSNGQRTLYVAVEVVRPLVGLMLALFVALIFEPSFLGLAVPFFGTSLLLGLWLTIVITRRVDWSAGDMGAVFQMSKYSLPLVAVFLLASLATASDRFFLSYLMGPAAVGVYAAGASLAKPVFESVFGVINLGAFPRLVRTFEIKGEAAAVNELERILVSLLIIGAPSLVGVLLIAEPLVGLLIGSEFQEGAVLVVRAIAVSAFCAGLKSFYFDQVLHLHARSLLQSITLVPGIVVACLLHLILIPRLGLAGAAIACMAAAPVSMLLSAFTASRFMKLHWPWKKVGAILLACALMAVGYLSLSEVVSNLWATVPAAALVYCLACLLLGLRQSLPLSGDRSFA